LLWEFAGRLPPASEPSEINQALMELGATVCTPRTPGCARCPLLSHCRAAATGLQHEIPPPARRPELTRVVERAVVVRRRGQVLLMQHGVDERWAGLWNFLRFPAEEVTGSLSEHLQQRFGVRATVGDPFHTLTHGVTRYHITLHCHAAQWQSGEPLEGTRPFQWVTLEKLAGVPLPQSGRKLARLLVAEGTTTQRRLFAE
jgi:A/G-specific adenine glycosylase